MNAARKWDRKPVSDRDRECASELELERESARERDGMKVTSSELAEIMCKPMAKKWDNNQIGGSKCGTSFRSRKPKWNACSFLVFKLKVVATNKKSLIGFPFYFLIQFCHISPISLAQYLVLYMSHLARSSKTNNLTHTHTHKINETWEIKRNRENLQQNCKMNKILMTSINFWISYYSW